MTTNAYADFRWLERGRGDTVLFLHGLMGHIEDWHAALECLEDTCRPIALALPIFDSVLGEPSIAALARYVSRFLSTIGLSKVVLGGNSLGGHVALQLALSEPHRVRGLVLTGSSGLSSRGASCIVPRTLSAAFLRRRIEEVFFDPSLVTDELVESVRQTLRPLPSLLRALRFIRDTRTRALDDRLHQIASPALLVWGENDRITPVKAAALRFHALLPRNELVLIPSCGHAPMLERPDAFSAAVRNWLNVQWRLTPVPHGV